MCVLYLTTLLLNAMMHNSIIHSREKKGKGCHIFETIQMDLDFKYLKQN